MDDVLRYCMKGIVRYLNGDIRQFEHYKNIAINIYQEECSFIIADRIPETVKIKLYEMVGEHGKAF